MGKNEIFRCGKKGREGSINFKGSFKEEMGQEEQGLGTVNFGNAICTNKHHIGMQNLWAQPEIPVSRKTV